MLDTCSSTSSTCGSACSTCDLDQVSEILATVWSKPNGTHYHLMKWQLTIPGLTHSIGYNRLWCPIPTSFQPYSYAGQCTYVSSHLVQSVWLVMWIIYTENQLHSGTGHHRTCYHQMEQWLIILPGLPHTRPILEYKRDMVRVLPRNHWGFL